MFAHYSAIVASTRRPGCQEKLISYSIMQNNWYLIPCEWHFQASCLKLNAKHIPERLVLALSKRYGHLSLRRDALLQIPQYLNLHAQKIIIIKHHYPPAENFSIRKTRQVSITTNLWLSKIIIAWAFNQLSLICADIATVNDYISR